MCCLPSQSGEPTSVAQLDARPHGDQEVVDLTPAEIGNILSWRLIVKYFLQSFSLFCWFKKGNCQFLAKECAQYWLTALTPLGWLGRKTSTQTKFSKRGYSHRKNLLPGKWSCSLKETNVSADSKFFPFSLWVAIPRRESYTRKVNSLQLDWLPFKKKANTFICEYFFWGVTLRNCFCGIQETVYSVDHLQS